MIFRAPQRPSCDVRSTDAGRAQAELDRPTSRQGGGRHRARHRAERPKGRPLAQRLVTLPGAAAAVVTLTAVGVVVAGSASPTRANAQPSSATAALVTGPINRAADAATTVEARAAAQRAAFARTQARTVARERAEARARATRAAARAKLVAAQQAAEQAKQQAEQVAAEQAHDWVLPVDSYRFSSPFGFRWGRLHAGDDFAAPVGTPAHAMSTGTVIFAGQQSGYGTKLEIRYWDGTVSWYGHMSEIDVEVGDTVEPGEVVGATGNTGRSTGPHLHLEIHPDGGSAIDPKPWLAERGPHI